MKISHPYAFPKVNIYEVVESFYHDLICENEKLIKFLDLHNNLQNLGAWENQSRTLIKSRLIDDLIGVKGMSQPSEKEKRMYKNYFIHSYTFLDSDSFLLTDLGSFIDVQIITSLFRDRLFRKKSILEIGGGYGRLCEALFKNSNFISRYTLIDVIPSSLTLCKDYLNANNLEVNYLDEDNGKDISLCHPLDFERSKMYFDLIINIESFQEMNQSWVDYYTNLINEKTKVGAYFYHSNSFNYKNHFKLNLGSEWMLLKSINHPRHWTNSHKSEIYKRVK
jgi:hypothetical protein